MNSVVRTAIWLFLCFAITLLAWSWWSEGIVHDLFRADLSTEERLDRLKLFFRGFGVLAPLIYLGFVVVEVVVAPIPGLMLYAPGGILFGPIVGGSLALLGNVLGAGIACSLTRSIGNTWLTRFFTAEKLTRMQTVLDARGGWLIFLLRLNPLTSSDIVSYAAGFTQIPVWKVMLATACGMAPLCYAQAWLAEGLVTAFPWLLYPLAVACGACALTVVFVARRILIKSA